MKQIQHTSNLCVYATPLTTDNLEQVAWAKMYSRFKHGDTSAAKNMARMIMNTIRDNAQMMQLLRTTDCVVIPSPYNEVPNAAAMLTEYLVELINAELMKDCGKVVSTSLIHRKVTYTKDYGTLPTEMRQTLISNDKFFINAGFLAGKTIILVDDICITGTHEQIIRSQIQSSLHGKSTIVNVYYAKLTSSLVSPQVESMLNTASIYTLKEYCSIINDTTKVLVRPLKLFLSCPLREEVTYFLEHAPIEFLKEMHTSAIRESYFTVGDYQENWMMLSNWIANHYNGKVPTTNPTFQMKQFSPGVAAAFHEP